jgi:hypothetical protein
MNTLADNLHAMFPYWWIIVVGGAMAVSDLLNFFLPENKKFHLKHRVRLVILVGAVVFSQFLAYGDQGKNLLTVIQDKQQLSSENWHLHDDLATETLAAETLQKKLDGLQGGRFIERADSLRRRTIKLADELYYFVRDRQRNHPPYAYPQPNDPTLSDERKKAIKLCQDYDQETMDKYEDLYKDRMLGIVKEYQAKGIPTGYLDSSVVQRVPIAAVVNGQWIPNPQDELYQFRDLAYHVDARDQRIDLH